MDGTETGWGRPAEPAPRWRALLDRARHGSRPAEEPREPEEERDTPAAPPIRQAPASSAQPLPSRRPLEPRSPADPFPPPGGLSELPQRRSNGADLPPRRAAEDIQRRAAEDIQRRAAEELHRRGGEDRPPRRTNGAAEVPPRPVNPLAEPPRPPGGDPRPPAGDPRGLGGDPRPLGGDPRGIGSDPRPLDRRPVNPLDRRSRPPAALAPTPAPDSRPVNPLDSRPVNPLEARRPNRLAEGLHSRGDTEAPHSFFNPATRPVPPPSYPPARAAASVGSAAVVQPAPARPAPASHPAPAHPAPARPASAPPAPAPPAPGRPVAAPPATVQPTSPAPARIEWRQAQPEQDTDRAIALIRRKLGSPRVLAFANPKGGVHKTTATVLAAATIGSVRGRGVLAWDDNELRGTLGLRAGSARHARTIRHLVSDLLTIENMHGDELLQELDDYLRHASDGSYDVLAGEENPRFAQRLDQSTVRRLMDLLRRTHDVICVDTGNNVESVNWQTVMKAADQLVVTTVPREDAAFTADWMLDLLDETGMDDLVKNAVTLISCPSPGPHPLLEDLKKHFLTRTRAVAVVPYDPALEVGSSIEYAELQPDTRAAWLRAASTMIEPFAE